MPLSLSGPGCGCHTGGDRHLPVGAGSLTGPVRLFPWRSASPEVADREGHAIMCIWGDEGDDDDDDDMMRRKRKQKATKSVASGLTLPCLSLRPHTHPPPSFRCLRLSGSAHADISAPSSGFRGALSFNPQNVTTLPGVARSASLSPSLKLSSVGSISLSGILQEESDPSLYKLEYNVLRMRDRRRGQRGGAVDGEAIRTGGAAGGSEQEHGVVHVPWGLDHLHPHPLLLLDSRPLRLQLHPGDGMDRR
ncbi:hypothetical protein MUK42_34597 [Musa troglodytarum]|uniref:Uncharacterized protein n=1 Tax=Musa troglodytarum TaxID=320322 RepID=A0A9E7EZP5_9LILI|nr:hypothetical protein MUK42_30099 [Musa troglodytarum]URE22592.1 hypothetical protein MUK42_34597 [Musa troglodytarum]